MSSKLPLTPDRCLEEAQYCLVADVLPGLEEASDFIHQLPNWLKGPYCKEIAEIDRRIRVIVDRLGRDYDALQGKEAAHVEQV